MPAHALQRHNNILMDVSEELNELLITLGAHFLYCFCLVQRHSPKALLNCLLKGESGRSCLVKSLSGVDHPPDC
jgi:hypothetical protein